jgi:uncharacterized protein DUF547
MVCSDKTLRLSALALAIVLSTNGALAADPGAKPAVKAWAEILDKYVQKGRVDYKQLAANDLPKLDAYLNGVAESPVPKDKNEAIAFWLDAYDATVVRSLIAHGIPKSVLDVKGFFDAEKHKIGKKNLTLNQVVKDNLLPTSRDPRAHMAIAVGSLGSPILDSKPYTGSDVNARLDEAAKRYLMGPPGLYATQGWLRISKLFDWYAPDFGGEDGALTFVRKYGNPAILDKAGATPKVSYIDFNWNVNER